jgi:hypothetical protein
LEVEAIPEVPGAPSQALDHPRHFHPQVWRSKLATSVTTNSY